MPRSIVTFLLIASFGVLFVGCSAPEPEKSFEEFSFTADDLETMSELSDELQKIAEEEGVTPKLLPFTGATTVSSTDTVVLDIAAKQRFDALRATSGESDMYKVTNQFLNVRAGMSVSTAQIDRLEQGDQVHVLEIPNAAWAKVELDDGTEGFVSFRYIAKVTTEEQLAEQKKKYEGKYFVNFDFLNVRKEPDTSSEKLGELRSNAIIEPLNFAGEWARVMFEGQEGYVSSTYLEPFAPAFLVRQESYDLPILRYNANDIDAIDAIGTHVDALLAAGKQIKSLDYLYDLVLAQEVRDARVDQNVVVLLVDGITPSNYKAVSDALFARGVPATLFIRTADLGISGITEKNVLTLLANGFSLQSAGHTGDDLRALTDAQVELELAQSKKLLEDITNKEVYAVAYSRGGVNDRVMSVARDTGYLFGIGAVPDSQFTREDFLHLPSTAVSPSLSAEDVVGITD